MKSIRYSKRSKGGPLHIEAPGCIINVRLVQDKHGQEVTAIEILADGNRYSGDPEWWIEDKHGDNCRNIRVVQTANISKGQPKC